MNENHQTQTKTRKIEHYEDEIELMDILLAIWRWKYLIIAGTLAFVFSAAIISVITLKQQATMYRTKIVLKPEVLEIDKTGNEVFIDSPENIKVLIDNDLKNKISYDIMNSKKTKLSNPIEFQVDIPKRSNMINISIESTSVEDGTTTLNYLIKALSDEFTDKIKFIQKKIEKRIEEKKYEFEILLFKEKEIKNKIKKYEKELSDIEAKIRFLKERRDNSANEEYFFNKLSVENDYLNTFQIYFKENENAKLDLFEIQRKTNKLPKEIEKLEKQKQKNQIFRIVQSPITTELPKINKIRRNLILSSVLGFFLMLFLSFLLEYLKNYKRRTDREYAK